MASNRIMEIMPNQQRVINVPLLSETIDSQAIIRLKTNSYT